MPDELTPAPPEPWWSRERKPQPPDGAELDLDEHPPAGVPWLGQTEPFLRALARSLEPLEDRLTRIADAARVNDADLTRVAEETRDGLQEVTRAVSEVRGAVSSFAEEVRAGAVAAQQAAVEARTATEAQTSTLDSLSESLTAALRDTEQRVAGLLERAETDLGDAVSVTAARLREHQDQTAARLANEVATSTGELEEGLGQIRRLGTLIEGMSTRRGFRELVESEASLREEQAAFVAGLAEASRSFEAKLADVTTRAEELTTLLDGAARDAASLRQVPLETSEKVDKSMGEASERLTAKLRETYAEDLAAATTELRRELEDGVPVRDVLQALERLAGTQADLAAAHRDVTTTAGAIEKVTDDLRRQIEGWGTPRSAPHLAQEIAALDERVGAIEHRIAEDLAPAISALVSQQVVDALDERELERGGLFSKRRRGSRAPKTGKEET